MNIKRMGIDLAKQVFQLHGVDRFDKASERKKLIAPKCIGISKNCHQR